MTEYVRAHVVRDGDDTKAGPLRIVAATAGRKADGLNLAMDRADLGRFESNPVVMYGHDYFGRDSLPIGKSLSTRVDGDALVMDIEFDMDDPFAATVDRKYRAGIMNTFSIGFDAYDVDEAGVPARWELHEVSAVPIPLDPDAVVASGRSALAAALEELRQAPAEHEAPDDEGDGEEDSGSREEAPALAHAKRRLALHQL